MSLDKSIVVRNEFTHNGVNTPGRGTRGGSPGQYVLRYMARIEATETLTPVPDSPDSSIFDYATRYMLRSEATEVLKSSGRPSVSPLELQHTFQEVDKLTGRSFGNRGISLSDDTVRQSSQLIQDAFDEGHSVQKVILSFTEDYLKENGILEPNYVHGGRGSYKGNIDQLKMRQAIYTGVNKMTTMGNYANPEWVGVIQVDTNHVHAHLAIVDKEFSPSRMMSDGRDKGKLTKREMMTLRRGIQYELNEMKTMKGFHRQVSLERQNVVGYVKDYVNDHIGKNSRLQILMASLPEEQHLWRYGSNRKEIQYANELAEQYVTDIFNEQPVRSGYADASRAIERYINGRVQTENIDRDEQERLRRNGQKLLVERSVNGVYDSLKVFDKTQLNVRTPMLDIQSSSEDELMENISDGFDQVGFELRVRGYSNRRKHHQAQSIQYKELIDRFDETNEEGLVSSDAFILRQFYEEELEWNMALTDKYRSFFRINGRKDRRYQELHQEKYEQLAQRYDEIKQIDMYLESVDDGSIFERMPGFETNEDVFTNSIEADRLIEDEFGVINGSRAFSDFYREGFVRDLTFDKEVYVNDLREYTFNCFVDGVSTQNVWSKLQPNHRELSGDAYENALRNKSSYFQEPTEPKVREEGITDDHFNNVKALDIHHLGVDFYTKVDRSISTRNRENFIEAMQWREYFYKGADRFLTETGQKGQSTAMANIEIDVADMRRTATEISDDGLIPTIELDETATTVRRNTNTFSVDTGVDVLSSMQERLSLSVEDIEYELSDTDMLEDLDY